ncbi:hypothetical protein KUCAC02_036732, partial [Chaenocephalus aceratus]
MATSQNRVYLNADSLVLNLQDKDNFNELSTSMLRLERLFFYIRQRKGEGRWHKKRGWDKKGACDWLLPVLNTSQPANQEPAL